MELCSSRLSGSNCGLWGTHAAAVLENYSLWEASVGAAVKDSVPWEAPHTGSEEHQEEGVAEVRS